MHRSEKVNILVVDDLPEKLLVLGSVLEELGQTVVTARSGQEALRQVLDREFAVILLDVNMPGMDGYETAALIRSRKKSAHTPIIFITAFADELHRAQGYALGAVDYLLSPIVPEILRTKVNVFVELFQLAQYGKRQAEQRVALAEEQAARTAAEETVRRLNFMAGASKVLASSLELEAILRGLLRLVVPRQADLGLITLVKELEPVHQMEAAWVNSGQGLCTRSLASPEELHVDLRAALQQVLDTGTTMFLPDKGVTSASVWDAFATNVQTNSQNHAFLLRSVVILPLLARGRTLGALSLGLGVSRQEYGEADLALAEDLAGRAAIALDNARLYRDIREADHRKNEFLSMLAHELRNPLAPLLNGVQLLRLRGPEEPELKQIEDMMERQVKHLARMVDDLLDISRITRGKVWLQTAPVDIAAAAVRAVEVSRPLLDSRRQQFTMTLPPVPVFVEADLVRLAQVLTNLLNNAAKYTEEGGRVWLTVAQEGQEAVFRVQDTGMGIPPEMLSNVFDLFTQVERTLDRAHGGLGIGLTLVRRLVEMHGGCVQAYSPGLGKGSEFVVRLPVLSDAPTATIPPERHQPLAQPAGLRVLVVDDNVAAADSLSQLLRMAGHEVRTVHDGPGALTAAAEFHPMAVLLDIGLPGMDGYEVARHLRERDGSVPLFLVALTGYGQEEDLRRSQDAGFDQHLVKPADPVALLELLTEFSKTSLVNV